MYVHPFMWIGLILAVLASMRVQAVFRRYSRVGSSTGLTGAEAARRMLAAEGITDVAIEQGRGFLSDHYDPSSHTLRLSPQVYGSTSLAAIGVACHEAGHALQQVRRYAPLMLRTGLVPVAQLGSHLGIWVIFAGMAMQWGTLFNIGILLFGAAVLFTLVTLPVEWNASNRAKELMVRAGIVSAPERGHAAAVLNAAFLTYLAGAVSSILTLLAYIGMGRRRD